MLPKLIPPFKHTGLGKTLQAIALIEVLYRYADLKSVVCAAPVFLLNQWREEFDRYVPTSNRAFKIYSQSDTNHWASLDQWVKNGGVLLIGYECLRNIINGKNKKCEGQPNRIQLQNPQLLICDEGHRLKNESSFTVPALTSIRCKRKIILTGWIPTSKPSAGVLVDG